MYENLTFIKLIIKNKITDGQTEVQKSYLYNKF